MKEIFEDGILQEIWTTQGATPPSSVPKVEMFS